MKLVDTNVLIYAVNERSPNHERARTWLEDALSGHEPVGFAWVVVLAFLRLVTHPAIFANPLSVDEAIVVANGWLEQPVSVIVEPSGRHLDDLAALLRSTGTGGNLVTDAHVAALAVRSDATVVTFDGDFGRFPGVRWHIP